MLGSPLFSILISPAFQKCFLLHVIHTGMYVHNICIAIPSKYSLDYLSLSDSSQCSQSPPTLKCRIIHSLSLLFSHKIVTRSPLKSRNCTRKRLADRLRPDSLVGESMGPDRGDAGVGVPWFGQIFYIL